MELQTCEKCGESLGEYAAGKCDACIAVEDRLYDEEEARVKRERWEFMVKTLREAYPTRIPKEWIRGEE